MDDTIRSKEVDGMTYEEAKTYIYFIRLVLEREGLLEDKLIEALDAAVQALDYEAIPIILYEGPLKNKKLAVKRT
jgi:hypothetical protein